MKKYSCILFFGLTIGLLACKKTWLDKKPDKILVVPHTLNDLESLMYNEMVMNQSPFMGELSSDDLYIPDIPFNNLSEEYYRNVYLWADKGYGTNSAYDWTASYKQILYSNTVLEGLDKLSVLPVEVKRVKELRGTALFFRARAFYELSQIFTAQYPASPPFSNLGLPLRVNSNLANEYGRSSLAETYNQILSDLRTALSLLPQTSKAKTLPTFQTGYGFAARIFLSIENYDSARVYCEKLLAFPHQLMNFNALDTNSISPIAPMNSEILFHSVEALTEATLPGTYYIDSTLYKSYQSNDLRRRIFFDETFNGQAIYKTSLAGSPYDLFTGVAWDEIYLIEAECQARAGNKDAALTTLNMLAANRYRKDTFVPFTAATPGEALRIILSERRKELIYRGLRWSDLRRLNRDPAFQVTLTRVISGKTYTLAPNSLKYVLPIPPDEIRATGIEQNPR